MEEMLVPRLLDKATIDRAYALVRNAASAVTLDQWNRFARPQISSRSLNWPRGLMTIQNMSGCILGLFAFEVRHDLLEGRTLWISNIIVPHLPGRDRIWLSAIDAIDGLATINNCRAIRAELKNEIHAAKMAQTWIVDTLAEFGYSLEGLGALKRLAQSGGDIH